MSIAKPLRAALLGLTVAGCATSPPPPPPQAGARVAAVPPPSPPPSSRDIESTPPAEAPPPPENEAATPEAVPGRAEVAPGGPRLAWVNPARCLAACTYHPVATLVRVNERGGADPRGPFQVEKTALGPLRELLAAARAAGHGMKLSSAFRSYDEQARLFRTTKEKGRAARPGHSEHQLGTTIDLKLPSTSAIDWLAAHVARHGFVLSYPPGKQRTTGYRPEPWHVRFVGADIAAQVPPGGTLEELFRRRPELADSGDCTDCPSAVSRASCGPLTPAGACEGTVLTWCFDGARAAVDCAAFGETCARGTGASAPDCVPSPR